MRRLVLALVLVAGCSQAAGVNPQTLDSRYCGEPVARDPNGKISRDSSVLREFKKLYACPSTGLRWGPCPGWQLDHVIPLACGGCDSVKNLQWLPGEIKSCAGTKCKDRWERKVYCLD